MKNFLFAFFLPIALIFFQSLSAQEIKSLRSPNGELQLNIKFTKEGQLSYSFTVGNRKFINNSPLGFLLETGNVLPSAGWKIKKSAQQAIHSVWKPTWGKRAVVPDQYNELIIDFIGNDPSALNSMQLEARAYNDGVAFRYLIPPGEKKWVIASAELTKYNFSGDYTAWFYNGEHENIGPEKLSATNGKRMPVMTIRAANDAFLAIHESDLTSGDPLLLESKKDDNSFSVVSVPGKLGAGYRSAWRVILFGKTPGTLVDTHLIELLSPQAQGDFSWVKPGVAVWDWRINGAVTDTFKYTMTLPSWKRMIDFAANNNISYLVLDADWYGPEFGKDSDPVKGGKVAQVHEIITYGNAKGVGVWLYLNDVGGRNYPLEQTLKQYSDWGAAGIKYGFMNGSPEEKNLQTRMITGLCAKYRLLCDYHDGPVHPYGQMRTFPNAVTREYCHSQLDAHRVFQPGTFVTAVYVNMLAGPIDMCNGLADLTQAGRVDEPSRVPSSLAGEAARTLIVFSGVTIIPDIPENYNKHPEILQFIASQKMPWLESKTLSGNIGEHIVMARQASDKTWLVGAATNEDPRQLNISLSFLGKGIYEAIIIQDGDGSDYRTTVERYQVTKKNVVSSDYLSVNLSPGGGACVLLKPVPKIATKAVVH